MEEDASPRIKYVLPVEPDHSDEPSGYIKPIRLRSGPKRKRPVEDIGPKPDGYEQCLSEGREPPQIPQSEGGAPPAKVAAKAESGAADALRMLRRRLDQHAKSPTKAQLQPPKDIMDNLTLLMADVLAVAEHHKGVGRLLETLKLNGGDADKVKLLADSPLFKSVSFNLCVSMGSYGVIVDTVLANATMTSKDLACESCNLSEEDGRELMMRVMETLIKLVRLYMDKTRE